MWFTGCIVELLCKFLQDLGRPGDSTVEHVDERRLTAASHGGIYSSRVTFCVTHDLARKGTDNPGSQN